MRSLDEISADLNVVTVRHLAGMHERVGAHERLEDDTPELAAALARVRALIDEARAIKRACRTSPDCDCSYKDCYEHGKWHDCDHDWTNAVVRALDGA